jgi:hypothetical protein
MSRWRDEAGKIEERDAGYDSYISKDAAQYEE